MSKGIYIGLGSVVFLAMIGALALFNTWQIGNLEERLISVDQSVAGLKSDIGALNNRIRRMGSAGPAVAGGGGGGMSGGGGAVANACPNNMLTGPANAFATDNTTYGGTFSRAEIASSKGYNYLTENGADVQAIWTYVGGGLAERYLQDPDQFSPSLAWCIEVNEDYTEYTVHIRQDVYWHSIQPKYLERSPWLEGEHQVTAHDFKFAMDMIQDEQVEGAAPLRTYYQDLDRLEVVDDFTFKAVWKKKTFQSKTFTLGLFPMAKWIYTKDPDGKAYGDELGKAFNQHWYVDMMGMGPYRFDSFRENEYVKLVKNNDYFGELPAFDEIIMQVVSNPDQQLRKLQDGELDFVLLQPAQYQRQVVDAGAGSDFTTDVDASGGPADGKFGVAIFPRMAYRYLGWNADGQFFGDKRVRRAMTHALNRSVLIEKVFMGLGQITTGNFYPLSSEYDTSIDPWPYDLDAARTLLEEAGWADTNGNGIRDKDGVEFEFTMMVYGYRPEFISMAEFYKEDLKKIGVQLVISPVDWPTMQNKMNNKEFDAYTGGWAMSWESDPYQIWHSSQADVPEGSNRIGFRNKRADKIIETARETFETSKRIELFHEFHEIVHEEQPYTFFFADRGVGAWQPSLRNVQFQPIRPHDLALPWYKAAP